MKKIKQIITVITLAVIAIACGSSTEEVSADAATFSINAKIDALDYSMAYLVKYKDGDFVRLDSAAIKDGEFSFTGNVESPSAHYILFDESEKKIPVFIENSEISIVGTGLDEENITITGSVLNTQLDGFIADVKAYEERLKIIVDEYYAAEEAGDNALVEAAEARYEAEDSLKVAFVESYINDNLNSVIAPYLSLRYLMGKDVAELEELSNSFSDDIRDSEYVKLIEDRIAIAKGSEIGSPAPLFTQNDAGGNPLSLEDLRGSYVLIDFWASWCGPCRAENPNVVAAYEKYHHKGFEILGVSFDENKDKWLAAIEKDGLVWFQVSDLKGWGNAAGKPYGVRSIPHSVLVDKDGIIIAKDLRGEELHNKLEEIFDAAN